MIAKDDKNLQQSKNTIACFLSKRSFVASIFLKLESAKTQKIYFFHRKCRISRESDKVVRAREYAPITATDRVLFSRDMLRA